jgi:hypothetical protein
MVGLNATCRDESVAAPVGVSGARFALAIDTQVWWQNESLFTHQTGATRAQEMAIEFQEVLLAPQLLAEGTSLGCRQEQEREIRHKIDRVRGTTHFLGEGLVYSGNKIRIIKLTPKSAMDSLNSV